LINLIDVVLYTFLFGGLLLVGIGYFYKERGKHLIRMAGWLLFGLYWLYIAITISGFLISGLHWSQVWPIPTRYPVPDIVNAGFTGVAFPFFAYLGYQEYLSHKWDKDNESLKFIAGLSFIAGMTYFLIDLIPMLAAVIIYFVAVQTVWVLNLMGYPVSVYFSDMNYTGTQEEGIFLPLRGSSPQISIVLACTAIQAIVIFVAAIYCTKADSRRKFKGYVAALPVIHVLNIVRNVGVIYLSNVVGINFDIAHIYIGKTFSLIVLIFITFYIFKILPELHENIIGLVDLPKRRSKMKSIKSVENNIDKKDDGTNIGEK
jgi:archaeosortase A (PGF-CTERM-specific)